jgi:hypothetical protein
VSQGNQGSGWWKKVIALLCIVGSILAIYNTEFDIAPLQKQAELQACGEKGCQQLTSLRRTPFAQSFGFQVQANSARTENVRCTRAFVLFGEFTCQRGQ